jgi:hypothetical protein
MTEIQNMDVKKDPTLRATSSNRDEVPHLFLLLGAGVTPAQGSVKPTAGFTLNKVIYSPSLAGLSISPRLR